LPLIATPFEIGHHGIDLFQRGFEFHVVFAHALDIHRSDLGLCHGAGRDK